MEEKSCDINKGVYIKGNLDIWLFLLIMYFNLEKKCWIVNDYNCLNGIEGIYYFVLIVGLLRY